MEFCALHHVQGRTAAEHHTQSNLLSPRRYARPSWRLSVVLRMCLVGLPVRLFPSSGNYAVRALVPHESYILCDAFIVVQNTTGETVSATHKSVDLYSTSIPNHHYPPVYIVPYC